MKRGLGKHQRVVLANLAATLFQAEGKFRKCFGPKGAFTGIKVGEIGHEKFVPKAALIRLEERGWYSDGKLTTEGEVAYHEYLALKNASA